jgi:hypothetical protein
VEKNMYEYKIKLPFRVENCNMCPFRRELIINEPVESIDKLTGITGITRRSSQCVLKNESLFNSEPVDHYNSKCPLKGNIRLIEEVQQVKDNDILPSR